MELLRQTLTAAPPVKVMINIGALFDIPTGTFLEGRRGERILNGGLAYFTGVVGIGNNFKSTILHFMFLTAMSRIKYSTGGTYDTEVNMQEFHLKKMVANIREFGGEDIIASGRWVITDKTIYSGNKWYEEFREFLRNKQKNAKSLTVDTPFWNRTRSGPLQILVPTFSEVDSFTEFETDDVAEMQGDNELGESGGNTIHMRQGLAKTRLLMEAPGLNGGSSNFMLMTAHIGKESTMQNAGPAGSVPITKLKHLKNGDKIKGVTDKFTFVTHNCWHAFNATPLMAADKNGPLYPRDSNDKLRLDTDLNEVKVRLLRGKSGPSGMDFTLIVSQSEGVLPSLTEFHHLREHQAYGFEGNNINYSLAIYPDVKLSRTTIRSKIDEDARLRRALNITSEMCQMSYLWHDEDCSNLLCSPKELYDDLKALGYNWDELLDTRGWWTTDEEGLPPFLSTMDLLRMRKKLYVPFWMKNPPVQIEQ